MKTEPVTLGEAYKLAAQAEAETNGRNGDPSKRASWLRERRLACIVLELVDRLRDIERPLEVRQ